MRVSCSCPVDMVSEHLPEVLERLGVEPIITAQVFRVVYDGQNKSLGEAIVRLFEREREHEITFFYDRGETPKMPQPSTRPVPTPPHASQSSKKKRRKKR